jgi:hypothetical protein
MLEINLRSFKNYSSIGTTINIVFNGLGSLAILLYLMLLLYCLRIFTIGLPSSIVPWNRSTSSISYLRVFSNILIVTIIVLDKESKLILVELIACFVCWLFLTISSFFYITEFNFY